jgi:hypothetical protein
MLLVVMYRAFRQADRSSRGVLPTVVCRCTIYRKLAWGVHGLHHDASAQTETNSPKSNLKRIQTIRYFVVNLYAKYKSNIIFPDIHSDKTFPVTVVITSISRMFPQRYKPPFYVFWKSSPLRHLVYIKNHCTAMFQWSSGHHAGLSYPGSLVETRLKISNIFLAKISHCACLRRVRKAVYPMS